MSLRFAVLLVLACSSPLTFGRAQGFPSRPALEGRVDLPGPVAPSADAERQRALDQSPAWRTFQLRHGDWRALWNEATGSPHVATGPAFRLEGFADRAEAVDAAVRRFVASHPDLFGRPTLETMAVQRAGRVWYASYRQRVRGIPVLFEDWTFSVGGNGNLVAFRADAHRVAPSVPTRPALTAAAAREAARAGLIFDPIHDRLAGGEELFLLPYPSRSGVEHRLVYETRVSIAEPPAEWLAYVDAIRGEVLWRQDQVRHAIAGNVSGLVHLRLPDDPLTQRPFAHQHVTVGATAATTDLAGAYSAPVTTTSDVSASLSGPFCAVSRASGKSAQFLMRSVPDGSTVDIVWAPRGSGTTSTDSERDAFYHVNLAHDFLVTLDPGFSGNDFVVPVTVEARGSCGAFTFGTRITLLGEGGECPSMATLPDVVYHEYGHVTNDRHYIQAGAPQGMLNGALHEAMADVLAAFIQDDPLIGNGMRGPGTWHRNLVGEYRWPDDGSPDAHLTGLMLGSAFWELRQRVGLETATRLSHFAKYGIPDDPLDDGVAMSEFFVQTLVADDDDADLSNGTPNATAINDAFNAHGIGSGYFVRFIHAALGDTPGPGPFPVTATVRYDGPSFLALDGASPTLHYSIDAAPFTPVPLAPTGNPDEYSASIPAAPTSVVRYYLRAVDTGGGSNVHPGGAPERANLFLSGTQSTVLLHDLETDAGWTVGDPTDTATDGTWVRDEPVGTSFNNAVVQPDFDHTADPGVRCYVTENGREGDATVDYRDVDGGKTTLTTASFSALGVPNAAIEYFRWYTTLFGKDRWRVDLSNDGGASWVSVEDTDHPDNSWRRVVIPIAAYLAPTGTMVARFVAEDVGNETTVEAAVDDFRLIALTPASGATALRAGSGAAAPAFALGAASPNPSRGSTSFRYVLPEAGPMELAIYDLAGRRVRVVDSGRRPAGEHAVLWDGLDAEGRPVSSGAYVARLEMGGRQTSRILVRVR